MIASFFVFLFAFVAPALADCNVTVQVTCVDCVVGQKWTAELYTFNEEGLRVQVAHVPAMQSGDTISSGSMESRRRFLDINGAEIDTITCDGEEDKTKVVAITRDMLGVHALQPGPAEDFIPAAFLAPEEPRCGVEFIFGCADCVAGDHWSAQTEDELGEVVYAGADGIQNGESLVASVQAGTRVYLRSGDHLLYSGYICSAGSNKQVVRVTREQLGLVSLEDEPDDIGDPGPAGSVPHVVGWAAPRGDPVWTGNAGDFPSAPATNRRGTFAEPGVTQCSADKLPAVLGTADHISGGRPAQDALDDARAADLAPADWNGAYAIALRTAILGDQAAAVWCINPGDLNPTSSEGRAMLAAADPPSPAPPGVTERDLADLESRLREELQPPAAVLPPDPVVASPSIPFVLRKGGFVAFQYSTTFINGVAYPHAVAGGFVTFNLSKSERVGLEPYLGFGTDFRSDHCGDAEWGEASCSGWFLSANVGARLPFAVVKKDTWRLMVFPDLSLVADDITTGFTAWGELVSLQVGAEFWLTGKVPLGFSLETGGTRLAFMNASFQHRNGWAWPIRLDVKVAFK